MDLKETIRLLRVHHYIKNLLIFLPLLFSKKLFDGRFLTPTILGAIAFSLICSIVYIINDLKDMEKDRVHPTKKKRPLASGKISRSAAFGIATICFFAALLIMICGGIYRPAIGYLAVYFSANIFYSLWAKDIPILDVAILVAGFLIRVLFGAALTGIVVSAWLFLTIMAGTFYLALGKRRNELYMIVQNGDKDMDTRNVLKVYNDRFLDKNMYMCLSLANVFYALWAADNGSPYILWTVPLVLIISMKYSLDVEGMSDGDPTEVILHDKVLIVLLSLYVICILFMLYL